MNSTPHIAVVGSINVDLTVLTDAFPKPGETIFGREFHLGFGGKGANQAVAASLCGARVSMIARVGDPSTNDLFGPASIANLQSFGVDTRHVLATPCVSTGVAPIFVDSAGQNRILVIKGANDRLTPADIDAASDTLRGADYIVLQFEIPLETVFHTLRFARAHNIRTILNPAPAHPLDLSAAASADYFIPNESEAETLTGTAVSDLESAHSAAVQLLGNGFPNVIMTLGANGSLSASRKTEARHYSPFPVPAVDTSGAGDAFIGSLACFLSAGLAESEAIPRANLYAALSALKIGTQKSFATRSEFDREWSARS